ncbi:FimV/HubP family polar landmark protein [Nitrosovibrio sp. Nv4]|uniref:FimV/HubP family polar landmark protein n=1 Tax=Nitrosovibrio sp. Nv4 TaxID=1945880 RepID=UPI000BE3C194|nr:FimV/HubP family polar landmark protein [Nitrosovibrio sp. Nv4]
MYPAGLGRLTIISALGQPFKAEIDLVAVKKEEKYSLTARLASKDTFHEADVDYSPLLSTFKASIETRSDGQPYVRIISPQPVAEPLLNMLVELSWSSGRLLREYTVLLSSSENDGYSPAGAATQAVPAISGKAEQAVGKSDLSIKRDGTPGSASVSKAHTVYGPVKPGDTLAEIAKNIAPPPGVSFNQILVALHRANRNAFIGNNMHQLKTGPILRIPDKSEIGTISRAEANQEVKIQTADWSRRRSGDMEGMVEELNQTAAGKVDAPAEVDPLSAQDPPREVLKLSKGEAILDAATNLGGYVDDSVDGKGKARGKVDGQDGLVAMEEDAIAKHGSIREANERIALLEKNIEELQRLLELRNPALADMQKRAEAIRLLNPADPGAATSTLSPASERQSASLDTQTGHMEELTIASATDEPVEIAKSMQAAASPSHEQGDDAHRRPRTYIKSMADDLTANIEYLGGALVLLITGIVGVSMARGPREAGSDNDNENIISPILDSGVHDKAVAPVMSQGTHIAEPTDGAGPAAKCGTYYPDDHDTQTMETVEDASVDDPDQSEKPRTPGGSSEQAPLESAPAGLEERCLADINLSMDDANFAKSYDPAKKGFAAGSPYWHEIVSKIDLARAYQEMGDKDAAMQVLQEVMLEGDARQQNSARLILANFRGAVSE